MAEFFTRWSVVVPRRTGLALVLALTGGLAGCADQGPVALLLTPEPPPPPRYAARPGVSPRAAPLALLQVEGAPEAIAGRFLHETGVAAARREVVPSDLQTAAYVARGYLSAYPVDGGATIVCVWDLYDNRRQRVQRLQDYVVVRTPNGDAWSAADDKAIAVLADRAADSLAAALTNTPEAIAASGAGAVVAADLSSRSPIRGQAAPSNALR